MARKKIVMSPTQATLFAEMKKLSKQANQRIVRLERLTGETETFATKQLADYLSAETLNAWSEKGRVGAKKGLSELQMKSIIKATKRFLQEETSRVAGAKSYTKKQSELAGIPITYKQASVIYKAQKNYTWIYQYLGQSEFWDFARETVKEGWSRKTFIENIMVYITDRSLDETLQADLQNLYDYAIGVQI